MKKDDVVDAFNQACIALAAFMYDYLEEEFPDNEDTVTIPFIDTQMPNIEDIWWDEKSIIDYENFFSALSDRLKLALAESSEDLLKAMPHLYDEKKKLINKGAKPSELQYLSPHMVGNGSFDYGQELRETNGFETLHAVCSAMDNIGLSIWMFPNPNAQDLKSAYMLAVRLESQDAIPLADKIREAEKGGLFRQVKTHYGIT